MLDNLRSLGLGAALIIAVVLFEPSAGLDRSMHDGHSSSARSTMQMAQAPGEPKTQSVPEQRSTEGASDQTLSQQLNRSNGVIKPPSGIDPQVAKPPPKTGSTPVIPPPGSLGSPSSVEPK